MKFDWSKFTEDNYNNLLNGKEDFGQVYVGDMCIELVAETRIGTFVHDSSNLTEVMGVNFYVAHEDTGYGYKDDILPYDYADGFDVDKPYGLSYDEFKTKMENLSIEYIEDYKGGYSLIEHANKPLEIW